MAQNRTGLQTEFVLLLRRLLEVVRVDAIVPFGAPNSTLRIVDFMAHHIDGTPLI